MKSHRGLSAVIGTVFLVIIVVGALSYVTYALNLMGNFSEQLVAEESRQKNIRDEKFELISVNVTDVVTPSQFKLDATIKNTGEIPLQITTLYLDEEGVNDVIQKITIDKTIPPGKFFNFLTEGIDVDLDPTKGYNMKFVSSRGDTRTFYLNSASQESLDIQLIAVPNTIPRGFTTTLMMTVVNNMSNNNPLVNLTPVNPVCNTGCTDVGNGATPKSYDSLGPGEVAIFRWSYSLTGDSGTAFDFTGSLQNGVPGNDDSETVTITAIQIADVAGQAIQSAGFGTVSSADDLFVIHTETYGIPVSAGADYQLKTALADTTGTSFTFDGTNDVLNFFSANATVQDITIPAGNWNASLRYSSARLPSGMAAGASDIYALTDGGHTLHFNTDAATARLDSGTDTTCTSLVSGGTLNGATWSATNGVNSSGAYYFDGVDDYISILSGSANDICNRMDKGQHSIAGWFKSTVSKDTRQIIFEKNAGSVANGIGGYQVSIGDSTAGSAGDVIYTFYDKSDPTVLLKCTSGLGSNANYSNSQWHHFVATFHQDSGVCDLYVDSVWQDDNTNGALDHEHSTADVYIGTRADLTSDFTGYIDDLLYWNAYILTQSDVNALFAYSFGADSTRMNFFINNATGTGVTVDNLNTSLNAGIPWGDPMNANYIGGNYTIPMNPVGLKVATENRLNFTMQYASGGPITFRMDDNTLGVSNPALQSSYIQIPHTEDPLPVFYVHDNDFEVNFYAYNGDAQGAWFTYQGTRIVFNGTLGAYSGLVHTISNGVDPIVTLDADTDGPFIDAGTQADVVYYWPVKSPSTFTPSGPPAQDRIPPGTYDVFVYINGYDEDGSAFIRNISLGEILVIE